MIVLCLIHLILLLMMKTLFWEHKSVTVFHSFFSCLLPDPSKTSKRKTPVKKRNLNPTWNHKFSYDNLTIEDLKHKVLELTVWDNHLLSNVFLGCVRIGMGTGNESWDDCRDEEVKLWEFVLSKPNTWAESTLPLRSNIVWKSLELVDFFTSIMKYVVFSLF